jgi:hypothetical protein
MMLSWPARSIHFPEDPEEYFEIGIIRRNFNAFWFNPSEQFQ